jgi:cobalt-zinc-cadmium efflux system protein
MAEHAHDHAAVPPASQLGKAFAIGIVLNLTFVCVEATYGWLAHSVALVADAAHNLSDVLGLAIAWGATILARRLPSLRRTYGLRRSTILAALANAVLLLVAVGGVLWEAIGRLRHPEQVDGWIVIWVAAVGVAINGISAWLFSRDRKKDVNVEAAFLHLAADAVVSFGVVLSGIVTLTTGWQWVDPAVSMAVSLAVLVSTWSLLKHALDLALDAVPRHIEPEAIRAWLESRPGVATVHDLHIWGMSTTEVALTAHVVMTGPADHSRFVAAACKELCAHFGIAHPTLQIEHETSHECALAPDEVV